MEFKVSFDLGPAPAHDAPLVAAIPGDGTRADFGRVLWRSVDGERQALLEAAELQALALLGEFRSRDEHAARLAQAFQCPQRQAAGVLERLVAHGILVDSAHFLRPQAAPAAHPPPPLVAIRTFRRPAGLERLFESALADEHRFGSVREYLIVDDAVDAADGDQTTRIAGAFARNSRSRVRVLGPAQRDAALAELARSVGAADRERAQQLFDPRRSNRRGGARGWNWAILASAGATVSFVDDDTCFPMRRPPGADPRIEPVDSIRASTRYYDDHAFADLEPLSEDPFVELLRWIGQDAGTLLARHGVRADLLQGVPAVDLDHWRRGGRVSCAFTGIYGGLAFNSAVYLNRARRESLDDLWRPPYRHQRLEADAVWHGVRSPRLLSYAVYTPSLLDNRALLPFAGTHGHADDTYFLGLLNASLANPLHVFVPALMGHFPLEARHRLQNSLAPLLLDRSGLMAHYFDQIGTGLRSDDRSARLAAIGAFCADLAASDDRTLTETYLRWRQVQIGSAIDGISEALAANPQAPAEWRRYAERVVAVNRDALLATGVAGAEIATVREAFAEAAFGCRVWPALWQRFAEEQPLDRVLEQLT